jgi:hypothetical protein
MSKSDVVKFRSNPIIFDTNYCIYCGRRHLEDHEKVFVIQRCFLDDHTIIEYQCLECASFNAKSFNS